MSSQAGKGDKPRNCFSQNFRDNYDQIVWKSRKSENKSEEIEPDEEVKNESPSLTSPVTSA